MACDARQECFGSTLSLAQIRQSRPDYGLGLSHFPGNSPEIVPFSGTAQWRVTRGRSVLDRNRLPPTFSGTLSGTLNLYRVLDTQTRVKETLMRVLDTPTRVFNTLTQVLDTHTRVSETLT
jgi:hypothetical protein